MSLKKLYISLLFSIGLISCDDLNKSANNFSIENNTLNRIIYNNDTLN